MTITIKQLANAINNIAEFFNEASERTDNETGEVTIVNEMAYVQDKILNGLCYNANFQLSKSVEQQDKAASQVASLIRSHKGDEISETRLTSKLDWKEKIDLQVSTLSALLEEAEAAYEKHTGKPFTTGSNVRKGVLPKPEFMTDAMKRAADMGIANIEGDRKGGIDAAEAA